MKKYKYVIVITGEIDAIDDGNALFLTQMGFSLSGRLLKTPNEITVHVEEKKKAKSG